MKPARLGPRLLGAIVLASTCLALLATSVQLYLDYRRDLAEIDHEFRQIEDSCLGSLARNLWSFDGAQTQVQLDGLVKMRDVQYAELQRNGGEPLVAGKPVDGRKLQRQYTLRSPDATRAPIATLAVEAGLDGVYRRLLDRLLVILATQATTIFLVALFILFIVSRWIVRHLHAMAEHAQSLSIDNLGSPLTLYRPAGRRPDELDAVVGALNDASRNLAVEIERRAQAERGEHVKSDFLARMSHELRTPLNAILGYAQLLQMDEGLATQHRRGAETIVTSGRHLLALLNDVLDHARIESGRLELKPQDIALETLLNEVVDINRVQAEAKGLRLVSDVDATLPQAVRADARALRQVLLNLLSNAVKFTEQGEVWLRVQRLASDSGEVRLHFAVQDSGIGIAPAQFGRLFHPFEQAGTADRRSASTGLGLAISRQRVRAMGGDILVDSTPGAGSRFSFELKLPLV